VAESSPQDQVARLSSGYWHTQAIYVAAKLGITDALKDGPRSADELAASTGMNARSLYRLLPSSSRSSSRSAAELTELVQRRLQVTHKRDLNYPIHLNLK